MSSIRSLCVALQPVYSLGLMWLSPLCCHSSARGGTSAVKGVPSLTCWIAAWPHVLRHHGQWLSRQRLPVSIERGSSRLI